MPDILRDGGGYPLDHTPYHWALVVRRDRLTNGDWRIVCEGGYWVVTDANDILPGHVIKQANRQILIADENKQADLLTPGFDYCWLGFRCAATPGFVEKYFTPETGLWVGQLPKGWSLARAEPGADCRSIVMFAIAGKYPDRQEVGYVQTLLYTIGNRSLKADINAVERKQQEVMRRG